MWPDKSVHQARSFINVNHLGIVNNQISAPYMHMFKAFYFLMEKVFLFPRHYHLHRNCVLLCRASLTSERPGVRSWIVIYALDGSCK